MAPFKTGIEKILARNPVPVIPVCLNGLWGSYFSKKYGKGERKAFRRKWSRITVEFGKPIPPEEVTAEKLYEVISKMKVAEA
jgi:1-acyl-sn-glycerol-3-phosphate acyltransferase